MLNLNRLHLERAAGLLLAAAWLIAPAALIAAGALGILARPAPAPVVEEALEVLPDYVNFIDRFSVLDTARWRVSDGWSNGEWTENDWRASQARVTPDGLALVMEANPAGEAKRYASGELQSHQEFQYGYFEARMRVPRGEGVVTGMFTYTREEGLRSWHEIDMEFVGRDTTQVELTYFVGGRSTQHIHRLGFDAADDYHTYAFEWTRDAIRWYVDNRMVHEERGRNLARMTREQRLFINLWNTDQLWRWTGNIDPSRAPWTLSLSCVAQAREYRGASLCAPPPRAAREERRRRGARVGNPRGR
ncbi:MAG: family 16 glycosylhydrolase [Hyphomonadaceae bacterium]